MIALLGALLTGVTMASGAGAAFDLPLEVDAALLQRAKLRPHGDRVVLFVPRAHVTASTQTFTAGPVRRATWRNSKFGSALMLFPRKQGAEALSAALKVQSNPPSITLAGAAPLPETAALPERQIAPGEGVIVAGATTTPSAVTNFLDADKKAVNTSTFLDEKTPQSTSKWFMAAAMGIVLVGLWAFFVRRKSANISRDASIEVIAVRSLGGKHKLALVQTCGERLLVAASDKELTVLTHLTPAAAAQPAPRPAVAVAATSPTAGVRRAHHAYAAQAERDELDELDSLEPLDDVSAADNVREAFTPSESEDVRGLLAWRDNGGGASAWGHQN